jgi:hypothetical protein
VRDHPRRGRRDGAVRCSPDVAAPMTGNPTTVSGAREEHPVSSPTRWARSPLDYHAHLLLPEGEHPSGVLKARCGKLLTTGVTQHDQPLPGLTCQRCRLTFRADPDVWDPREE